MKNLHDLWVVIYSSIDDNFMVEVIRDTERQSRINLGLQKWVCILTIILTVFTAILLWIGLVQIKLIHINQNPPTEMQTKE